LNKLINVIKILEHEPGSAVERELMVVKVWAAGEDRARVMEIAEVFRVNIVDVTGSTLTLEATGKPDKLEALLSLLDDFGIVELSRTGRIALGRGDRGIKERVLRAANDGGERRPRWPRSTTRRTPTPAYWRIRRSRCSGTARRAMPTRRTCGIAALTFGWGCGRARRAGRRRSRPGSASWTSVTPSAKQMWPWSCCPIPRTAPSMPRRSPRTCGKSTC